MSSPSFTRLRSATSSISRRPPDSLLIQLLLFSLLSAESDLAVDELLCAVKEELLCAVKDELPASDDVEEKLMLSERPILENRLLLCESDGM